jgi:hypothetical protein
MSQNNHWKHPVFGAKIFYNLVFSHSKSQSRRDLLMLGLLGGAFSSTLTCKIIFEEEKNMLADNSFSPIIGQQIHRFVSSQEGQCKWRIISRF